MTELCCVQSQLQKILRMLNMKTRSKKFADYTSYLLSCLFNYGTSYFVTHTSNVANRSYKFHSRIYKALMCVLIFLDIC